MIQPRNDRVLIRRIEKPQGSIVLTDPDKGIEGVVLAIGPGKWIEGTWWYFATPPEHVGATWVGDDGCPYGWKWISGYRQQMKVKIGQRVYFNSKWNDMGNNYDGTNVPLNWDGEIHLVSEGDIFGVKNA